MSGFKSIDEMLGRPTLTRVLWTADGLQHLPACRVVNGMRGYEVRELNVAEPICPECRIRLTRQVVES